MQFRSFLNSDPPALCEIWRSHASMRGKFQGIGPNEWEQLVLGKPYFDPAGLILAIDDSEVVGFVHASFGRTEDQQVLDPAQGVISQLMVRQIDHHAEVAGQLLARAEDYLGTRRAGSIVAGGQFPSSPFYLGLYGGSRAVGVLSEDQRTQEWFRNAGFEHTGDVVIRHWHLHNFRPLVDRQQMMIGRSFLIEAQLDPVPSNWCDACNFGLTSRVGFTLKDRKSAQVVGTLVYWDMEPLVRNWGVNGMGLVELWVIPELRQKGIATYMVGESLRQLKQQGVALVEIQHPADDPVMSSLCNKLGFQSVDSTVMFEKKLDR